MASRKNGERSYFAAEIQFSAETTQSAIQNQHYGCMRLRDLHTPPKTQNWTYSGLENKQTEKHV